MFDPHAKPPAGFTLNRRELAQVRAGAGGGHSRGLQRREWRLVVMLPLAVAAIAVVIDLVMAFAQARPGSGIPPMVDAVPAERPPVDLPAAGPLPDAAAIAGEGPTVAEAMDRGGLIRFTDQVDAATMAWAERLRQRDGVQPPIPVRVDGVGIERDLVIGTPVIIDGKVSDARIDPLGPAQAGADPPADLVPVNGLLSPVVPQAWVRILLTMEGQRQVLVLAPADAGAAAAVVIGRPLIIVGRTLGLVELPVMRTSSMTSAELLAATPTARTTAIPLLVANRLVTPSVMDKHEETAPWLVGLQGAPPESLTAETFAGVSDERAVLESRPYYLLLGQTLVDLAKGGAPPPSGNMRGTAIHNDPAAFRGQRFTVSGYVHRVQRDALVAIDHPFGIEKVWRVLAWSRDLDPVVERIASPSGPLPTSSVHVPPGSLTHSNGAVRPLPAKTMIRNAPLRLYEFCISGDQGPPPLGARIVMTGRFFKFRAISVRADNERDRRNDVIRQSGKIYPFVYVGAGYQVVPDEPSFAWTWFDGVLLVIATVVGALAVMAVARDMRRESTLFARVRHWRLQRRKRNLPPSPPPSA